MTSVGKQVCFFHHVHIFEVFRFPYFSMFRSAKLSQFFASAGSFQDVEKARRGVGACEVLATSAAGAPAQSTDILQSAIPPEQAVDRTFSDLSTLGGCQKENLQCHHSMRGEDTSCFLHSPLVAVWPKVIRE